MKTIRFSLVTPERKLMEEDIVQITLPLESGEVTILPDHIPLIAMVMPGEIMLKTASGKTEFLAISGGFVEFRNNVFSLLADAAERADEIDLERAIAAEVRARELREKKADMSVDEQATMIAALERAGAWSRVARKHRSHRGILSESKE